MGRKRKKPYKMRKPYKMKTGGPPFKMSGMQRHPSPIAMMGDNKKGDKSIWGMVASMLERIGFRVNAR